MKRWTDGSRPHPPPGVSDLVNLRWGSGICISNRLLGHGDAAGSGTSHTLRSLPSPAPVQRQQMVTKPGCLQRALRGEVSSNVLA